MLFNFDPFEPLISQAVRTPAFIPATDVLVSDGDLVLAMDVRKLGEAAEKANLTHRERTFGKFERRINVPEGVDPDAITASLDNGVLSLIVPKPEKLKPKAITITTGSGNDQRQLETTAN
jgi:HSP20 family protein